jgi:hypothetical protein
MIKRQFRSDNLPGSHFNVATHVIQSKKKSQTNNTVTPRNKVDTQVS